MADLPTRLEGASRAPRSTPDVDALWARGRARRRRRRVGRAGVGALVALVLVLGGLRLVRAPADAPVIGAAVTAERVALAHPAGPLAASAGHVWVADYAGTTVSSPTGGAVLTIDEPGRTCELIATTPRPTVRRCGGGDDRLVLPDGRVTTVASGVRLVPVGDEVWEVTSDTVRPLGSPQPAVEIGSAGRHRLRGGEALWVTDRHDDGSVTVRRLTPGTDTARTWSLGPFRRGSRLAPDGEGGAWVLDQSTGAVWLLDDGGGQHVADVVSSLASTDIAADVSCAAVRSGRTVTLVTRDGATTGVELANAIREVAVAAGRAWLRTVDDELFTVPCPP